MKEKYNLLEDLNLFPIITEGEDDGIDLDTILQTGVGNDYVPVEKKDPPEESEEDKAARLKKEAEDNRGEEEEEEGNEELSNLDLIQSLNVDDSELTEDNKAIRDQLLSHFKGESFDSDGNVIDKDGKVIANFEDVDKFISDEPTYDKEGNEVDDKGTIIKTKSEVTFEKSAIHGVINDLDYDLVDDTGKPVVYEDTLDGWKQLAKDIGKIEGNKIQESFINSNPVLREVAKHLLSGNTLETFNNPIDYSNIDKTKLTEGDKLQLIRDSFLVSGMDKDRTESMVDLIKSGNAVDKELDKAIGALTSYSTTSQEKRDQVYQQKIKDEEQSIVQYWGDVKQEINKGTLGDLKLPKEDQDKFYNYISKSVDQDGNSQEMLDRAKDNISDDLKSRYLRYKGYNMSTIVKKEVQKNQVSTLRNLIDKSKKDKSKSVSSSRKSNNNSKSAEVNLDNLLS